VASQGIPPPFSNFNCFALNIAILGVHLMVILVSEASNRYTHLFQVEREYFGFNTIGSGKLLGLPRPTPLIADLGMRVYRFINGKMI
jgi:hypothetical protein